MGKFKDRLAALDESAVPDVVAAEEISEERRNEIMDFIAGEIVDRNLTTIALMILESIRPVTFLGSQFMVFLKPFVTTLVTFKSYAEMAAFFEEPSNTADLIDRIERLDKEKKGNRKQED